MKKNTLYNTNWEKKNVMYLPPKAGKHKCATVLTDHAAEQEYFLLFPFPLPPAGTHCIILKTALSFDLG